MSASWITELNQVDVLDANWKKQSSQVIIIVRQNLVPCSQSTDDRTEVLWVEHEVLYAPDNIPEKMHVCENQT